MGISIQLSYSFDLFRFVPRFIDSFCKFTAHHVWCVRHEQIIKSFNKHIHYMFFIYLYLFVFFSVKIGIFLKRRGTLEQFVYLKCLFYLVMSKSLNNLLNQLFFFLCLIYLVLFIYIGTVTESFTSSSNFIHWFIHSFILGIIIWNFF